MDYVAIIESILSVNEKLPVPNIRYFGNIYNTAFWLLISSCFWSTTNCFGEIKQLHKLWNYGACDEHAFYVFCIFKSLKSSFAVDNIPEYALDIFIENVTKIV